MGLISISTKSLLEEDFLFSDWVLYFLFYTAYHSRNREIGYSYTSESLMGTLIIIGWVSSEAVTEIKICVQLVSLEVIQGSGDVR